MLGLSLDEAKNVAIVAATVFAIGAIAAIWIMKSIVQKVLVAVLLVMLAFAAWSQRESLQECAEQVQANVDERGLRGDGGRRRHDEHQHAGRNRLDRRIERE